MNQISSDQNTIDLILQGDSDQYRVLVDRYQNFVYTLTLRILLNKSEPEEAAQDTFIKAFQALRSFSGKSKFSTWLYRIAFNTAISYKRKHRIEISGLDSNTYKIASSHNTTDDMDHEERRRFIGNALDHLSPEDVSVIILFYNKELSLEEISEITGMKNNAVKVKLFRARKRLAEELKRQLMAETESLL